MNSSKVVDDVLACNNSNIVGWTPLRTVSIVALFNIALWVGIGI